MIDSLKKKMELIELKNDNEINNKIKNTEYELKKMKSNINNIIFSRLYKELKKNNKLLLNINSNESNDVVMMRALTHLNILPISLDDQKIIQEKDIKFNHINQFSYFLLSKKMSKNINFQLKPFEFWKTLLKFKESEIKLKK